MRSDIGRNNQSYPLYTAVYAGRRIFVALILRGIDLYGGAGVYFSGENYFDMDT